ncbi:MAG: fasciclin domain-containing protein [Flavobacteriaceae bacterium]|nr:fasciclin domain-containing protein [Flavobacteriaceae bacterium]
MSISRIKLLTFCFTSFMLCACQETGNTNQQESKPTKSNSVDQGTAEQGKPKNASSESKGVSQEKLDKNAKLSTYRFIISREELSGFSQLLKASTFAKTIHNTDCTVFAPTNKEIKGKIDFEQLIKTGNTAEIDAIVGKYIVLQALSFKDFVETKSAETINGTKLKFNNEGVISVNGIKTDGEVVSTNKGFVYYLEGTL